MSLKVQESKKLEVIVLCLISQTATMSSCLRSLLLIRYSLFSHVNKSDCWLLTISPLSSYIITINLSWIQLILYLGTLSSINEMMMVTQQKELIITFLWSPSKKLLMVSSDHYRGSNGTAQGENVSLMVNRTGNSGILGQYWRADPADCSWNWILFAYMESLLEK